MPNPHVFSGDPNYTHVFAGDPIYPFISFLVFTLSTNKTLTS